MNQMDELGSHGETAGTSTYMDGRLVHNCWNNSTANEYIPTIT